MLWHTRQRATMFPLLQRRSSWRALGNSVACYRHPSGETASPYNLLEKGSHVLQFYPRILYNIFPHYRYLSEWLLRYETL